MFNIFLSWRYRNIGYERTHSQLSRKEGRSLRICSPRTSEWSQKSCLYPWYVRIEMLIFTGYMYCTYNGQQQQKLLVKHGICVIAYLLPLFVVKLFENVWLELWANYHVKKCPAKCIKFSIYFNSSILLEAVRNYFCFVPSFSHNTVFLRGWGRGVLLMSSDFGSVKFVQVP